MDMYLLVLFGSELEKYYGRRAFVGLYLTMLLLPPLAFTLIGLFCVSIVFLGSTALHFGLLVAFAALYPRAEIFFGIQVRWLAAALMGILVLQCMAFHQWPLFGALLLDAGAALLIVNYLSGRLEFLTQMPRIRQPSRSRLKASRKTIRLLPRETSEDETIDPILDKISREGISSLTPAERERLERAREALIARERRH